MLLEILKWIAIVIGSLVLLLILLAVLGVGIIRWKVKRFVADLGAKLEGLVGAMTSLPGFRLRLEPAKPFEWHHPDQAEGVVESLKSLGFVEAGRYIPQDTPDMRLVGLVNERESLMAAVYDQSMGNVKVDVVFDTRDGQHWTITNVPDNGMDRQVSDMNVRLPEANVETLVEEAKSNQRGLNVLPVARDGFADSVENAYAEEMNWRVNRGGYTLDEVRRAVGTEGGALPDELIEQFQIAFNTKLGEGVDEVLSDELEAAVTLSEDEWEEIEDRIIFVYDMLQPDQVADLLECIAPRDASEDVVIDGDEEERFNTGMLDAFGGKEEEPWREKVMADAQATSARRAFANAIKSLPRGSEVRKLATLESTVGADAYVMPSGSIGD